MPLFKQFTATNLRNAFILNALATAIMIVIAVFVQKSVDNLIRPGDDKMSFRSLLASFLATFIAGLITYAFLFWLFGFGGGMLTSSDKSA